jgi:hypothetical protein
MSLTTGNKVLHLNCYFKLPEDFNGDLNDALQALIDYRKSDKNHEDTFEADEQSSLYENWWNMIHTTDRPFFAEASISEYNNEPAGDIESWKTLPL